MGGHLSALLGVGQTAEWISRKSNLKGKVAVVTGATTGIGFETARVLCKIGAKVYMGCHEVSSGEEAREKILHQLGWQLSDRLVVSHLDLSAMETVKSFASAFLAAESRVDFLVLNAGVSGVPKQYTREGHEWHFGVNFLGQFYLCKLLFPTMIANEDTVQPRIIVLVCSAWKSGKLCLQDLEFRARPYTPLQAYSQSKLACWLFVQELAIRLKRDLGSSISVFAADPGATDTGLLRNVPPLALLSMCISRIFTKNVGLGSATIIYACITPKLAKRSGSYLENCRAVMVRKNKRHPQLRFDLWEKCEEMTDNVRFNNYVAPKYKVSSGSFGAYVERPKRQKKTWAHLVKSRILPLMSAEKGNTKQGYEMMNLKSE